MDSKNFYNSTNNAINAISKTTTNIFQTIKIFSKFIKKTSKPLQNTETNNDIRYIFKKVMDDIQSCYDDKMKYQQINQKNFKTNTKYCNKQ